jgi:ferrous iron transport protein B
MLIILARMPGMPLPAPASLVQTAVAVLADGSFPHRELMLELPPMRTPRLRSILVTTWRRTWAFMKEAVPLFLLAAFLVFLFHYLGGLRLLEAATRPLMESLLGLPESAVRIFMKTIIRREAGAVELHLLRADFSNLQLVVALLTMTLLIPCVNTMVVLFKERGARSAGAIVGGAFLYALLAGGLVNPPAGRSESPSDSQEESTDDRDRRWRRSSRRSGRRTRRASSRSPGCAGIVPRRSRRRTCGSSKPRAS